MLAYLITVTTLLTVANGWSADTRVAPHMSRCTRFESLQDVYVPIQSSKPSPLRSCSAPVWWGVSVQLPLPPCAAASAACPGAVPSCADPPRSTHPSLPWARTRRHHPYHNPVPFTPLSFSDLLPHCVGRSLHYYNGELCPPPPPLAPRSRPPTLPGEGQGL